MRFILNNSRTTAYFPSNIKFLFIYFSSVTFCIFCCTLVAIILYCTVTFSPTIKISHDISWCITRNYHFTFSFFNNKLGLLSYQFSARLNEYHPVPLKATAAIKNITQSTTMLFSFIILPSFFIFNIFDGLI